MGEAILRIITFNHEIFMMSNVLDISVNIARLSQAAFGCNCGTDSERTFVACMYVLPFARATTISTVPKPGAQWGKST